MPEILEIESYRRHAAPLVGHRIETVDAPDAWYLKGGIDEHAVRAALVGRRVEGLRRRGKLLVVDLDDGTGVGLRFGMTGRLVVDGVMAIDRLEYGSDRRLAAWCRLAVGLDGGHWFAIDDPRRLGGVELDPAFEALGVDAFDLDTASLAAALDGARGPLKARLMDQQRIAGLGNLLTDEALWRAGLDPARDAASLSRREVTALAKAIATTLQVLGARGGSHTGDLHPARARGATCPRRGCGGVLERRSIGGRTTFSCRRHQH